MHQRWFADGTAVLALSSSPSGADLLAGLAATRGAGGTAALLAEILGTGAQAATPRSQPGDLLTVIPSLRGFGRAARPGPAILGFRPGRPDQDLAQATIEATAFRHRLGIELLGGPGAGCSGPPAEIRVAGGLAASELWVQLLADVTGLPVRVAGTPRPGPSGRRPWLASLAEPGRRWPSRSPLSPGTAGSFPRTPPAPLRSRTATSTTGRHSRP